MTPQAAIDQIRTYAQPGKATQMAAYHKVDRPYLGVSNPDIYTCVATWRAELDMAGRLELASGLWDSNIHEARVAAAKLLTQARIKDREADVWAEIKRWIGTCDAWAIADHAAGPGARRLRADPARLDDVEAWTTSSHLWTKRAALVMTLPWTKSNHPSAAELEQRDRILGWAATYVTDRDWFIQKAIAWWVRELSKHDAPRARTFLETQGQGLKSFARREAGKYLAL